MIMAYTVKNNNTGRSYQVEANNNQPMDIVWASQRCWFTTGSIVTITAEDGISKTYIKE